MLSISEGSKLKVEDGDEMEDEFDEYLEQSLISESLIRVHLKRKQIFTI